MKILCILISGTDGMFLRGAIGNKTNQMVAPKYPYNCGPMANRAETTVPRSCTRWVYDLGNLRVKGTGT